MCSEFSLSSLAAQEDRPQCVHNSAQKEGCCEAVAEAPGSVKVLHCLIQGEGHHTRCPRGSDIDLIQ